MWLANLLAQDDRKVMWIVDEKGGLGKSAFARYIIMNHDAFWTECGRTADIACAYEGQRIAVFDFGRSEDSTYWPYRSLESMKNGAIFSGKYESQMKLGEPVQVIVMSNVYPDISKLSMDRWDIWHYDKDQVLHRGAVTLDPLHIRAVHEGTSNASGDFVRSDAYNATMAQIPALGSR